jgi:hypothetical protein
MVTYQVPLAKLWLVYQSTSSTPSEYCAAVPLTAAESESLGQIARNQRVQTARASFQVQLEQTELFMAYNQPQLKE